MAPIGARIHTRIMIVAPMTPTRRSTPRVAAVARASSSISGGTIEQLDSARRDDQVIEIAKNGNEIGDQVNGAEGMCNDKENECFCIPGHAWVTCGQVDCIRFCFQCASL